MWVTRKYAQNIICKIPFSSSLLSKILPPFSSWEKKNITYHHWAMDVGSRSPSLASTDSNWWGIEALPHAADLGWKFSLLTYSHWHCPRVRSRTLHHTASLPPLKGENTDSPFSAPLPLLPSLPTSPQLEVKSLLSTDRQWTFRSFLGLCWSHPNRSCYHHEEDEKHLVSTGRTPPVGEAENILLPLGRGEKFHLNSLFNSHWDHLGRGNRAKLHILSLPPGGSASSGSPFSFCRHQSSGGMRVQFVMTKWEVKIQVLYSVFTGTKDGDEKVSMVFG